MFEDSILKRPTVSPYLQLLSESSLTTTPYHSLVRPALEQQRINQTQSDQFQRLQQQVYRDEQYRRQQPGQGALRPTGHRTYFGNLSHYYQVR
jgi:hypothetical protein